MSKKVREWEIKVKVIEKLDGVVKPYTGEDIKWIIQKILVSPTDSVKFKNLQVRRKK